MWRRSASRLCMGERKFTGPSESALMNVGGLPFFGNIYAGPINAESYRPQVNTGRPLHSMYKPRSMWDDPVVQAKIKRCPYFALCDQVTYHNMDPCYLDPGILTGEEHQLLLLFSRAYFEKWKAIHRRPPVPLPHLRIHYGRCTLLNEILALLKIPAPVSESLKAEYLVDDAALIAMEPDLWTTAFLDPANLDHLSGRVLDFADMAKSSQQQFILLLRQMRRLHIVRRDTADREEQHLVVPFREALTLFDLYQRLDLVPYSGQLKVYDLIDDAGTPRVITLQDEDTYFDYLMTLFYRADVRRATLGELADDKDYTCRFTITVEPYTVAERRVGRWF